MTRYQPLAAAVPATDKPRLEEGSYILNKLTGRGPRPRDVYVWFVLERAKSVDTVLQEFEVELVLSARWLEDKKDHINVDADDTRWSLKNFAWQSEIAWRNMLGEDGDKYERWFRVYSEDMRMLSPQDYLATRPDKVWVKDFRRQTAKFATPMLVHRFPFDVQFLAMTLTSKWDADSVLLRFCDSDASSCMIESLSHLQGYTFSGPQLVAYDRPDCLQSQLNLLSDPSWSKTGVRYSRLHIAPLCERVALPYLTNIVFTQCMLTTLAFGIFRVQPYEIADRLSLDLGLILTTVAFKMAVSSELPKVPYLTALDTYLLVSFAFLSVVTCEHVWASTWMPEDCAEAIMSVDCEGLAIIGIGSMWLIINVVFFFAACCFYCSRLKTSRLTNTVFEEFAAPLRAVQSHANGVASDIEGPDADELQGLLSACALRK